MHAAGGGVIAGRTNIAPLLHGGVVLANAAEPHPHTLL
jgi:hypothetical protein